MADVQWIKLSVGMFQNRKIRYLLRKNNGYFIVTLWLLILQLAGKSNANGDLLITDKIPYSIDDLSDALSANIKMVKNGLSDLLELDMIIVSDDGIISVKNWEKYQSVDKLDEMREQSRERSKRYRARKRHANVT